MFGGWANCWLGDLLKLDASQIIGPPYACTGERIMVMPGSACSGMQGLPPKLFRSLWQKPWAPPYIHRRGAQQQGMRLQTLLFFILSTALNRLYVVVCPLAGCGCFFGGHRLMSPSTSLHQCIP